MLDFQRLDLRVLGIFLLQTGNKAAAFIAQFARLVEAVMITRRNKTAIARQQRQCFIQRVSQLRLQCVNGFGLNGQCRTQIGKRWRHIARRQLPAAGRLHVGMARQQSGNIHTAGKPLRQSLHVARATARQSQPRQSARHIGKAAQNRPHIVAQIRIVEKIADRLLALCQRRNITQRRCQPRRQFARTGGGDGQVNCVEQAATHLAGQCAGQLQIGACGRVQPHQTFRLLNARRRQARHGLFLRELQIGDDLPAGNQRGTAELAKTGQRVKLQGIA